MKGNTHRLRPQRSQIFFGCEGKSEQSYGKRLDQILKDQGLSVHLHLEVLGGGDALTLVQLASDRIAHNIRTYNSRYAARVLLLDFDTAQQIPNLDRQIDPIISKSNMHLIWQRPCHESFLLSHLGASKRPATSSEAMKKLTSKWPGYVKPMSALKLRDRITKESVLLAAKTESNLYDFLASIGFIET